MIAISRCIPLIVLASLFGGCSPRWPHRYDTLNPAIDFQGFGKVIVLSRDERSSVQNGGLTSQQVGTVRSLAGDSWPIDTATGHAFAQDVSTAVCNALVGKGYECVPLVSGQAKLSDEIDYVQRTYNPVRILFFTINEWNSDVLLSTDLRYDLSLKIFNSMAETMVTVNAAGEERLGGVAPINPARYASEKVPGALQNVLQTLLNHERVATSMNMARSIDALGARYR